MIVPYKLTCLFNPQVNLGVNKRLHTLPLKLTDTDQIHIYVHSSCVGDSTIERCKRSINYNTFVLNTYDTHTRTVRTGRHPATRPVCIEYSIRTRINVQFQRAALVSTGCQL